MPAVSSTVSSLFVSDMPARYERRAAGRHGVDNRRRGREVLPLSEPEGGKAGGF
jgi:hypothetical protein